MCIVGANDSVVDEYTARLHDLNKSISKGGDRIGFKSLIDIFSLSTFSVSLDILENILGLPPIPHHFPTKITEEAELCRKILMSSSNVSRKSVRERINGKDPAILSLYRGFSKFMLEDLELHPSTKSMSKSKRRKIATAVSFEMILVCLKFVTKDISLISMLIYSFSETKPTPILSRWYSQIILDFLSTRRFVLLDCDHHYKLTFI